MGDRKCERTLPERSLARVTAQAPGHRFTVEGFGIEGRATLEDGTRIIELSAGFPLARLKARDPIGHRELRRFLNLDRNPIARVELVSSFDLSSDDPTRLRFSIDARQTEVSAHFERQGVRVFARFPLRFSALGFTPPRLLFLSVRDELTVEIEAELTGD